MRTHSSTYVIGMLVAGAAICLCSPAMQANDDYLLHPLSSTWGADSIAPSGSSAIGDNDAWWKNFGDPVLDSLISLAETNNYDVQMAARRIAVARNSLGSARSAYYPQLAVGFGWTKERMSGMTGDIAAPHTDMSYFSGTATMSWEVDVFGKITSAANEAKANVRVSAADFGATMLSVDAQVASTYIGLLVSRMQLQVANEHSANQKHIVDITETRYRTGLASKLDVAQAKTLYYSTVASVPLLVASIDASVNALGVLTGLPTDELPAGVRALQQLPDHHQLVATGVPLDLLRRRPDIVAAERAVDAAAAALGIARKDYLPSLTISGSIGTQAHRIGDLFTSESFGWSVAPALSWTLFDGLSRRYAAASAKENMQMRIESYNLAVLTAIEEVNNAISRYHATLRYIDSVEEVVVNSAEAVKLSLDLYKQGLTAFSNVVDAQLNYLTYQNTLISARGQALSSLIDLYKALGGGWNEN